jgi:DNA-binding transcriptional MerR regulator
MLKIGEFSQLSQVTIKTLHHYDSMGLLQPAHIDPSNGYRYYQVNQLPRLHRIMALKDLGLSLEQISLMLDGQVSTEQIRGMLHLRQAEIKQTMKEEQRRLAMIEFRLRMVEAEINFPELDVVIKRLEPMRFLSMFVGQDHTKANIKTALLQAFTDGRIDHTGVTLDVFHGETILPLESPDLQENQHEILLSVSESQGPVSLEGIGDFNIRELPGVETAATLLITGNDKMDRYEKVALLRRWAVAHGYKPHKLVRYLNHRGPLQTSDREKYVIEAQLPVE